MKDYIMGLSEPLTIDDLKPMLDAELHVRVTGIEWRKEVVKYDRFNITGIKLSFDIGSDSGTCCMIYMDYWLKGELVFNACIGLKGLQSYLAD